MGNHESSLQLVRNLGGRGRAISRCRTGSAEPPLLPTKGGISVHLGRHREVAKAEAPPRFSFLYIHLMDKSMFPMWFDKGLTGAMAPMLEQVDMAGLKNMLEFGREIVRAGSGRSFPGAQPTGGF